MKRTLRSFLFLYLISIISCSDISTNPAEEISALIGQDQLKISNNTDRVIYLFIVEQNLAARINWAPLYIGPHVKPGESIFVNFSDISNGSDTPVKSGDNVIIYYWSKALTGRALVKNISVSL